MAGAFDDLIPDGSGSFDDLIPSTKQGTENDGVPQLTVAPPKPLLTKARELLSPLLGETANQTNERVGGSGVEAATPEAMIRRYGVPRAFLKIAAQPLIEGPAALASAGARNLWRLAEGKAPVSVRAEMTPPKPPVPGMPSDYLDGTEKLSDLGVKVQPPPELATDKTQAPDLFENLLGGAADMAAQAPAYIATGGPVGAGLSALLNRLPQVYRVALGATKLGSAAIRAAGAGATGAAVEAARGGDAAETLKAGAAMSLFGPASMAEGRAARMATFTGAGMAPAAVEGAANLASVGNEAVRAAELSLGRPLTDEERERLVKEARASAAKEIGVNTLVGGVLGGVLGVLGEHAGPKNPFEGEIGKTRVQYVDGQGRPIVDPSTGKPFEAEVSLSGPQIREAMKRTLADVGWSDAESERVLDGVARLIQNGMPADAAAYFQGMLLKKSAAGALVKRGLGQEVVSPSPGPAPSDAPVAEAPTTTPPPENALKKVTPSQAAVLSRELAAEQLKKWVPSLEGVDVASVPGLESRISVIEGMIQKNHPQAERQARLLEDWLKNQVGRAMSASRAGEPPQSVAPVEPPSPTSTEESTPAPSDANTGRYRVEVRGDLALLVDNYTPNKPLAVKPIQSRVPLETRAKLLNEANEFDLLAQDGFLTEKEKDQFGMPVQLHDRNGHVFTSSAPSHIEGRDNDLRNRARLRVLDLLQSGPDDPARTLIVKQTQQAVKLRAQLLPLLKRKLAEKAGTDAAANWDRLAREWWQANPLADEADMPADLQETLAELETKIDRKKLHALEDNLRVSRENWRKHAEQAAAAKPPPADMTGAPPATEPSAPLPGDLMAARLEKEQRERAAARAALEKAKQRTADEVEKARLTAIQAQLDAANAVIAQKQKLDELTKRLEAAGPGGGKVPPTGEVQQDDVAAAPALPETEYNALVKAVERGEAARRRLNELPPALRADVTEFAASGLPRTPSAVEDWLRQKGTTGTVDDLVSQILRYQNAADAERAGLDATRKLSRRGKELRSENGNLVGKAKYLGAGAAPESSDAVELGGIRYEKHQGDSPSGWVWSRLMPDNSWQRITDDALVKKLEAALPPDSVTAKWEAEVETAGSLDVAGNRITAAREAAGSGVRQTPFRAVEASAVVSSPATNPPRTAAGPHFELQSPTEEQLQSEQLRSAQKEKLRKLQEKRLTGTAGDLTGDLFDQTKADNPLFAPPPPKSTGEKLEDFGEKLGGARKDRVASVERHLADTELEKMSLSEIWPKQEVDALEDNNLAAMATVLRDVIPAKPRTGYKLRRWVETVKTVRSLMALANERGFDAVMDNMSQGRFGHTLEGVREKIKILSQLPRAEWGRIGRVVNYPNAIKYVGQVEVPSPYAYAVVDGKPVEAKNLDDLAKEVAKRLASPVAKTGMQFESGMQFEIRAPRVGGGSAFINKQGDPLYRPLKEFTGPDAVKEAKLYLKEHRDDLVKAWEAIKERDNVLETDVRRETNRLREGQDYRQGKDATPEMFQKAFGFRGVEFGNWVQQGKESKERQWMLNEAYDALQDLAAIIGVPTKALSLNGELGLAFGSRGSGRASAHYEPDTLVINLTKTRGAGALAHEWFHALDHYFQRQRGMGGIYITFQPEGYYENKQTGQKVSASRFAELKVSNPADWKRIEGVRPEVEEAFADLVKALNDSPMAARSALIDKGQPSGYWSQIFERAARAFENYVIYKMQQKGFHNDYLANVVSWETFTRDKSRYPYLLDKELAPVEAAFDNLFGTLQAVETPKGVMLRERGGEYGAQPMEPRGPGRTYTQEELKEILPALRRHGSVIYETDEQIRRYIERKEERLADLKKELEQMRAARAAELENAKRRLAEAEELLRLPYEEALKRARRGPPPRWRRNGVSEKKIMERMLERWRGDVVRLRSEVERLSTPLMRIRSWPGEYNLSNDIEATEGKIEAAKRLLKRRQRNGGVGLIHSSYQTNSDYFYIETGRSYRVSDHDHFSGMPMVELPPEETDPALAGTQFGQADQNPRVRESLPDYRHPSNRSQEQTESGGTLSADQRGESSQPSSDQNVKLRERGGEYQAEDNIEAKVARDLEALSSKFEEEISDPIGSPKPPKGEYKFKFKGKRWTATFEDGMVTYEDEDGNWETRTLEIEADGDMVDVSEGEVIDGEGKVPADIWEGVPEEAWESPSDPSDPEQWEKHYSVEEYDSDTGWGNSEGNAYLNLREALRDYHRRTTKDKRLVFYDRGRREIVLQPSFVQKLLDEFPSMPRDVARRIADSRNSENEDPWLVTQAYVRHNYTNYDDLLQEAREKEDGPATETQRAQARRAVQEKVNEILRQWEAPSTGRAGTLASSSPGAESQSKGARSVAEPLQVANENYPKPHPDVKLRERGGEYGAGLKQTERLATELMRIGISYDVEGKKPVTVRDAKLLAAIHGRIASNLGVNLSEIIPEVRGISADKYMGSHNRMVRGAFVYDKRLNRYILELVRGRATVDTVLEEGNHAVMSFLEKAEPKLFDVAVTEWSRATGQTFSEQTREAFFEWHGRQFRRWLQDEQPASSRLARVFAKVREWLAAIWNAIRAAHADGEISPTLRRFYESLLKNGPEQRPLAIGQHGDVFGGLTQNAGPQDAGQPWHIGGTHGSLPPELGVGVGKVQISPLDLPPDLARIPTGEGARTSHDRFGTARDSEYRVSVAPAHDLDRESGERSGQPSDSTDNQGTQSGQDIIADRGAVNTGRVAGVEGVVEHSGSLPQNDNTVKPLFQSDDDQASKEKYAWFTQPVEDTLEYSGVLRSLTGQLTGYSEKQLTRERAIAALSSANALWKEVTGDSRNLWELSHDETLVPVFKAYGYGNFEAEDEGHAEKILESKGYRVVQRETIPAKYSFDRPAFHWVVQRGQETRHVYLNSHNEDQLSGAIYSQPIQVSNSRELQTAQSDISYVFCDHRRTWFIFPDEFRRLMTKWGIKTSELLPDAASIFDALGNAPLVLQSPKVPSQFTYYATPKSRGQSFNFREVDVKMLNGVAINPEGGGLFAYWRNRPVWLDYQEEQTALADFPKQKNGLPEMWELKEESEPDFFGMLEHPRKGWVVVSSDGRQISYWNETPEAAIKDALRYVGHTSDTRQYLIEITPRGWYPARWVTDAEMRALRAIASHISPHAEAVVKGERAFHLDPYIRDEELEGEEWKLSGDGDIQGNRFGGADFLGPPYLLEKKGAQYDSIEKIVEKTQRNPAKAEGQEADHLPHGQGTSVLGDWWKTGAGLTRITPDGKTEKIPGAVFSAVDTQKIVQWQGTVAGMPLDRPEQRAAAARVFRDPTREHLVIWFAGADRRAIGALRSEGVLDASPLPLEEMIEFAEKNNPQYLALSHNHPSGISRPSVEDAKITARIVKLFTEGYAEFDGKIYRTTARLKVLGHTVINGGTFHVITPGGDVLGYDWPSDMTRESWETVPLETLPKISTPEDLAAYTKGLAAVNRPVLTVLYRDTQGKLRAVWEVPVGKAMDWATLGEEIAAQAARFGAYDFALVSNFGVEVADVTSGWVATVRRAALASAKRASQTLGMVDMMSWEGQQPVSLRERGAPQKLWGGVAGVPSSNVAEVKETTPAKGNDRAERYRLEERHGRLWVVDSRTGRAYKPGNPVYSGSLSSRPRLEKTVAELNAEEAFNREADAEAAARSEAQKPGTVKQVTRALTAAVDGPVLLPRTPEIAATARRVKGMMDATWAAFKTWRDRPAAERYEGLKQKIGQPHEFLRGTEGVPGSEIWNLKKMHDTLVALNRAAIMSKWGLEMLKPDVASMLLKIPYFTPQRVAQIGRTLLQIPGLAEKLGIPQRRQRILFRAAEAIRGFTPAGEPMYGALVSPNNMEAGWRYTPEEAEAIWKALTDQERRLVKLWDERRRELAEREGLSVSLEGYMRRYREQNSFQRLLDDMEKERSPLASMVAGFRKARKNAPGFMEDFYRAVVGREIESAMERLHNDFVQKLETMIARRIEPVKGNTVYYGETETGEPERWEYDGPDPKDSSFVLLRKPGEQAVRVGTDQLPLIRVAPGQPARENQVRSGEVTVVRRYGPFAGELVAVDKVTYEYFKEFLAEENPGYRSALANFLWGRNGGFWREIIAFWKLNQLSGNMDTALTNAIGNATFYSVMFSYDSFYALETAALGAVGKSAPKEVRAALRQVLRDLWAPFYALAPAALKKYPVELFGGKESTMLGDLGVRTDRGGILGLADELRGKAGSAARGVLPRLVDIGGGAVGGTALGGMIGGQAGAMFGGAVGATVGLRKLLEVGMIPFGLVENYARRATLLARMLERDDQLVEKLVNGTAPPEAARQLDRIFDSLRVFQIDYTADPLFMKKMAQGAVPFLRWIYGFGRQVSFLVPVGKEKSRVVGPPEGADDLARRKLAGALTLALMAYLIPSAIKLLLERKDQPGGEPTLGKGRVDEKAPARFQADGRQFVGRTTDGEEMFLRTTKYPYVNLYPLLQGMVDDARAMQLKDTPAALQGLYKEGVSAGPSLEYLAWLFGYRQDWDLFKDPATMAGEITRAFVPFHRLNERRQLSAQARADGGEMYLVKPKGFWANISAGLPPELNPPTPSAPEDRVLNRLTGEFVKLKPDLEALKEWTGINLRTLDPGEYLLWKEDQQVAGLKEDVGAAGRLKEAIVGELAAATGKDEKYLGAVYDMAAKEVRRTDRAALRKLEKTLATGAVDGNELMAAAARLAMKNKELKTEIALLLLRDLPMETNLSDVNALLKRSLLNRLRTEQEKTQPDRIRAETAARAVGAVATATAP